MNYGNQYDLKLVSFIDDLEINMDYYKFLPGSNSSGLRLAKQSDGRKIIQLLSHGKYEKLEARSISLVSEPFENNPSAIPDIPFIFPEGLLCKENAYHLLAPCLKNCGGWNEFQFGDSSLYYFSIVMELDILDEEKSEFLEHDGFRLGVKRYVFKEIDCTGFPIFRMKSVKGHFPIVTQEFVDFVLLHSLDGLEFEELT